MSHEKRAFQESIDNVCVGSSFYRRDETERLILEFSVYPIDRYQNAIHELKQIQEHFTLMPHDSFGHLNTLCMSVLSLSGGVESEWKRSAHRSALKKRLAFEYESSFITQISNGWIPH